MRLVPRAAGTALHVAGLSVARIAADIADPAGCDLAWRIVRVDALPFDAEVVRRNGVVRRAPDDEDDGAIDYLFGHGDAVRCHFRVHADGSVTCWAAPGLNDHDIDGLFGEAILRVVLRQRRLPSFHAAALVSHGRAILIMGDKGAGKSTLAAALARCGWEPIADDLARVEHRGEWATFPGVRTGKLHADSAVALGFDPEALVPRWTEAPAGDRLHRKLLVTTAAALDAPLDPVPIAAIVSLGPRRAGGAAVAARLASPLARVRALVRHATADPLDERGAPPQFMHEAIAGLARSVPVYEVSLVDSLERAGEAAAAVGALADRICAPTSR